MRISVISDLHVDACPWEPPPGPPVDLAIVAGDVADGLCRRSIPWVAEYIRPRARHVIYVPGNHDFYRCRIPDEIPKARELAISNDITLLDSGQVRNIGGLRVIGATLWTDYLVGEPRFSQQWAMRECGDRERGMRDHRTIQTRDRLGSPIPFRPPAAQVLHIEHRGRIERALTEAHPGPTIVVTHHAPHPRSLLWEGVSEPTDAAYASDLSALMQGESGPDLWVHGHIHRSVDYHVGRTRVISNPRGHDTSFRTRAGEWVDARENPSFDPQMTLEI